MIFGTPPPQHLRGWGGVKLPAAARLPGWAQELVVVPIKVGKITIKVGALGRVADGCLQWASQEPSVLPGLLQISPAIFPVFPCSSEQHRDRHVYKHCPYFHRSLEIITQVLKKQLSSGCG